MKYSKVRIRFFPYTLYALPINSKVLDIQMKTNKLFRIMMMLLLIIGATFTFSACSDDEAGGLSGAYAYTYQDEYNGIRYKAGYVIWFEKGNCHFSGLTDNTNRSLYADWVRWSPLTGHSGWYFEDDQNHHVYSYVVEGSMIILSNGDILTKDGDSIYRDGMKYTKF